MGTDLPKLYSFLSSPHNRFTLRCCNKHMALKSFRNILVTIFTAGLLAGPVRRKPIRSSSWPCLTAAGRTPASAPANSHYFNEGASRFNSVDSVHRHPARRHRLPDSGRGIISTAARTAMPNRPRRDAVPPSIRRSPPPPAYGATNTIPAFIQQNGPVRVVRFIDQSDGTPDGGVHDLFIITGRSDAAGCRIAQPDFATAVAQNNTSFRIPIPLFGAGMIEAISDTAILDKPGGQRAAESAAGHRGEGRTAAPTTAPLRALDGRRRISRC